MAPSATSVIGALTAIVRPSRLASMPHTAPSSRRSGAITVVCGQKVAPAARAPAQI